MPLSPQITITPEDLTYKSFTISAVTYTSSTATYTATGHTFSAGDSVMITGLAPDGYNGTYTITTVATNTFTVANTTNTALTDQSGNAYWASASEYAYEGGQLVSFGPNNLDIADPNVNPAISSAATAITQANQAISDAATALSTANTAISTANTANTNATNAAYQAGVAQTTANGKNKVNYSTSGPSGTGTNGDIWFQLNGSQNVIAQYTYQGGSWVQNQITNTVIANLDAGKITAGTISGIAYNNGSGTFSVSPSGTLVASDAIITGNVTATSGTFTGTIYASSGTFTGTISGSTITATTTITGSAVNGATVTGGTIQTSTGSEAVVIDGSTNAIRFKSGGSYVGNIVPLNVGGTAYGLVLHYGPTPDGGGGTRPQVYIGNGNVSMFASSSYGFGASTTGNSIVGNVSTNGILVNGGLTTLYNNGTIYANTLGTTTAGLPVYQVQSGANAGYLKAFTSARRFKTNIRYIDSTGYLSIIDDIKPVTYDDIHDSSLTNIPGLIAEELAEVKGVENLVVYNEDGETMGINYEKLSVMLILALKELKAEFNNRLSILEGK